MYTETLSALSALPQSSVYRQATEKLTKGRLETVEKAGEDIAAVESQFGTMIEVAIVEAEAEKALVGKMAEWKA